MYNEIIPRTYVARGSARWKTVTCRKPLEPWSTLSNPNRVG